jgi:tetratricopeptide (TPR) repeat protein
VAGSHTLGSVNTSPLVGRETELRQLQQLWQAAQGGAAQFVCLVGEPGIGKSRLLRELASTLGAGSVRVLEGQCSAYQQRSAFYALAQALDADLGLARDANQQHRLEALQRLHVEDGQDGVLRTRLLAGVLRLPLPADYPELATMTPQQVRAATFDALTSWLVSRRSATLLIVEDLHWADPSTLEFLARIASEVRVGSVLTLVTARPELELSEVHLESAIVVPLQRLNPADTERVVRHLAGERQLPASVLQRLVIKGEGNPLFIEEMTRAIFDSEVLGDEELTGFQIPESEQLIPTTLQNTLMARLDLLGRAKPTAQLAAVLGREFPREVLQEVWRSVFLLSDLELERDLRLLLQSKLLLARQEGNGPVEYSFKHALVQDAAYQSLLRTRRREYHHRVADVLRQRFPELVEPRPDLLAHHYSAAAQTKLAVEYWEKAGQQALQVVAHLEAISHFRAALDQLASDSSLRGTGKEMDLLVALGVVYIQTKGFASPEVEQTYGRAVQLCDETGETPLRVLYGLWAVNLVRSQFEPSSRLVRHFERLASSEDAATRLVCQACLGNWHFYRGNYAVAQTHLERAAALCDREEPRRQHDQLLREHGFEGLLYGPLYLAWCLAIRGQPGRAEAQCHAAMSMAERIGDPYAVASAQAFGATIYQTLGDVQRVQELAEQVRDVSARKGFPFWLATASVASGWALALTGQPGVGISRIQEGLQLLRTIGARMPYPYYLSYLVEAHLVIDQLDEAETALEEALQMSASNIDCNHEPELLRLKAMLSVRRGEDDQALGLLRRARHLAAAQGGSLSAWSAAEDLAVRLAAMGQPEEARRVRERIREDIPEHFELTELYRRRKELGDRRVSD